MSRSGAIILNPFCDNACVFCGNRERAAPDQMREQEELARKNVEHHLARGIRNIEISGGDPGEFDRLPELIRDMKRMGVNHVRLSTNGCRCSDPAWADALVDAGLDAVKIPLYGSTAAVHEQVARKPGAYDQTLRAMEHFKRRGVPLSIHVLVVRPNRENLLDLYRLMLTFTDWRRCGFGVPCLAGDGGNFYVPIKDLQPDLVPLVYYGAGRGAPPVFFELPQCVLGFPYPHILRGGPPSQGLQQPPEAYRSDVEDVPTYRLKSKPPMCRSCARSDVCDGFFTNDLRRYGTGSLVPFAAGEEGA